MSGFLRTGILKPLYNYCASLCNEEIGSGFHLIFTVTKFAICIHLLIVTVCTCVRNKCSVRKITMITPPDHRFYPPREIETRQRGTIATTISYQLSARAVHARAYTGWANW